MIIGGIMPFSLVDYPGLPAATVFTLGCNLRCPFCHNVELVEGKEQVDSGQFFTLLEKRVGLLDGVCITGGEPTLQRGLADFAKRIKTLGFNIKLDTNGSRSQVLAELLEQDLLDYVAVDIKAPPQLYAEATRVALTFAQVVESVNVLRESQVEYELRTTVVPGLIDLEGLELIQKALGPVPRYALQQFRPQKTLDPSYGEITPFDATWFIKAKEILQAAGTEVVLRGINS
ncbi:MAG: anaerobic ribonucleoside-triphosphate reductase activating protein [Firmicutes bacterium]|nr:anaerobic ribonucleoside-triphosphate reductase activating protein [Bacillota bacterium]